MIRARAFGAVSPILSPSISVAWRLPAASFLRDDGTYTLAFPAPALSELRELLMEQAGVTKWEGNAYFGLNLIVFRGHSVANALHAMPVAVLAMSHDEAPVMLDAQGQPAGGRACLLRPMTPHQVAPERPVTIAFLSPSKWTISPLGINDMWLNQKDADESGFAAVDPNLLPDPRFTDLSDIAIRLEKSMTPIAPVIDDRLSAALDHLGREPGAVSIGQAAQLVGLSTPRLRAVAQRDLGSSLSHWLIWKKLVHAAHSVASGEGLAQSAASGGFVDQAHFANVMRRLLGTAPSEVSPVRAPSE